MSINSELDYLQKCGQTHRVRLSLIWELARWMSSIFRIGMPNFDRCVTRSRGPNNVNFSEKPATGHALRAAKLAGSLDKIPPSNRSRNPPEFWAELLVNCPGFRLG